MDPPWVYAFVAALAVSLMGTPLLRRLALATGIVDRPDHRKSHLTPVPYLGGVAIMAGVLVAVLFVPRLGARAAALAIAGVMLGAVGLLDDDHTVPTGVRFLAESAAAGLAVTAGLRIHATGIDAIDVALTVIWIVGITNALNLLDNMDGLAGGVAGTAAVGVFFLAILNGQEVTATLSAGLAGACGGFLVFNRRPASIFMGDAGSLFLGFVLAVLAIDVNPGLAPPASFVVPVILLGLAVLDTSTVTLSRLRRGRSVFTGGKDHLSHRLVALGFAPGPAVGVLLGVQALLALLAVLGGRRVVGLGPACAAALLTLGVLAVVTSRASVYPEPPSRFPAWLRLGLLGATGVAGLMTAPAVAAMVSASGPARQGAALAKSALDAVAHADPGRTRADLERAETLFRRAEDRLDGRLTSLGLLVPGAASNLRAARTLAVTGTDLTARGARLAAIADAGATRVAAGSVDADQLARLGPALDDARQALTRSRSRLSSADRPYVLPRFRQSIRALLLATQTQAHTASLMAETVRALPGMLGNDGARRYLLVVSGGEGSLVHGGELVAEAGRLRLEPAGSVQLPRPAISADALASPDFPTVAHALSISEPSGSRLDGVISVDARGLSLLAELADPAARDSVPVTAGDVSNVAGRHSMSQVSDTVWRQAVTADLGTGRRVVANLAEAVRGGHLVVYLTRPSEQGLMSRLGATGEVPAIRGDSVIVVGQSLSPEAADRYLHQEVTYDVRLEPGPERARLSGQVTVTLRKDGPAVEGPAEGGSTGAGSTAVSLYSAFPVASAAVDGQAVPVRTEEHLGRQVASTVVAVLPSQARTLRFDLAGHITLGEGGWYRLDLLSRGGSLPGEGRVTVSVADGWRIVETRGLSTAGAKQATGSLSSDREPSLWARVERSPTGRLWHSLLGRG